MIAEGPTLAEQEMLHDGEPIYGLAWGHQKLAKSVEGKPAGAPKANANRVFSGARARGLG